jgi:hypothetical protein
MHRLDEMLPVHIVFRTPLLDDVTLRSYLARLVLNIEAFVFSTAPPQEGESKAGASKELIYSSIISETDQPTIVRHGEGDDAQTYIIWKVDVFISRPQGRFHKPAIYFQPTASFKPASTPEKTDPQDEYLPSRVPTALNLLQAFENDPALAGVHPRLSAMRINKIAPNAAPVVREMVRPIRNGQRPLFRVLPALIWRVRYARIQTSLSDLSMLASLDLEVASYGTYDVRIKSVSLSLHAGTASPFANPQPATTTHRPGDQLTYLYKITPDIAADGTPLLGSKGHVLTMSVAADVLMTATCHPSIAIEWKTPVDFTAATEQTPSLIKAAHRLSTPATRATNPDALPAHDTAEAANAHAAIGLTLSISGPPQVTVGEIFHWTLFIVNRSSAPLNLAVLVLPKRKHGAPRPSTSSAADANKSNAARDVLAPAVVDENTIYATQKAARTEVAELVCLTTDVRLGALSPGACYTADLKFLAMRKGVLGVESVRVVDLGAGGQVDVRELPGVVAV